jgi:hypothetical protein
MNSLLNLTQMLPVKDLRKLFYAKLEYWDRALVELASCGHANPLRVFRNTNFQRWCARRGHIALLKCIEPHIEKCSDLCDAAACGGKLHVLTWLADVGCPIGYPPFASAASSGNVQVLEWLRDSRLASHGDFELIVEDISVCVAAAKFGHLPAIQWLGRHGFRWDARTCYAAAEYGHLHVLQWLAENGCPMRLSMAATHAVRNGHLHVLQWLHAKGWQIHSVCDIAAEGGHLHVLQWIKSQGCQCHARETMRDNWSAWACTVAAVGGHLDTLRWLVENGYPIHIEACLGDVGNNLAAPFDYRVKDQRTLEYLESLRGISGP